MRRMTLAELDASCQKLNHHRLGNWMARNVTRPAALRVTQIIAPWGFSANTATLCALLSALCAAASFAQGSVWSFVGGAALLQVWYLLDHVDGQLARLRRSESLDGVSLDYLMHHLVNLCLPLGIAHGLFVATFDPRWLWLGALWAAAWLLLGVSHDVRYKAFVQRWKRIQGQLILTGGAGGRPAPSPPMPRKPLAFLAWFLAKLCEIHVVMNLLACVAVAQLVFGDTRLVMAQAVTLFTTACVVLHAARRMQRLLTAQEAEIEFMQWLRAPQGSVVIYDQGWWHVGVPPAEGEPTAATAATTDPGNRSY